MIKQTFELGFIIQQIRIQIKSLMSSAGLSNVSSQVMQSRYEKALKQIDKLIEVNRQLKEQVSQLQMNIDHISNQYDNLAYAHQIVTQENKKALSQLSQLEQANQNLSIYCKKLQGQTQSVHSDKQEYIQIIKINEEKFKQQMEQKQQKYQELLRDNAMMVQGYQSALENLKLQLENTKKECEIANAQKNNQLLIIKGLKDQLELFKHQNQTNLTKIKDMNIEEYQAKVQQYERRIAQLTQQCKEQIHLQIEKEGNAHKHQLEQMLGFGDQRYSDDMKELMAKYRKSMKDAEDKKNYIQAKYNKLKIHKELIEVKLKKFQQLTERHQLQIVTNLQNYDKINAQHLKAREQLQIQIKLMNQQILNLKSMLKAKQAENKGLLQKIDSTLAENTNLKKVHLQLKDENERGLKDIKQLKESITINQTNTQELPSKQVYTSAKTNIQNTFQVKTDKMPMRVYGSATQKVKFIQSVNIINGYNVSVSDRKNHE